MYFRTLASFPYRYDDRGGAFWQCRITRQQLHHESDGTAACSYPGTRSLGVVARAHDNRPLLGLVAFRPRKKRASMLVVWCHCNEVNRRPPRITQRLPSVEPMAIKQLTKLVFSSFRNSMHSIILGLSQILEVLGCETTRRQTNKR